MALAWVSTPAISSGRVCGPCPSSMMSHATARRQFEIAEHDLVRVEQHQHQQRRVQALSACSRVNHENSNSNNNVGRMRDRAADTTLPRQVFLRQQFSSVIAGVVGMELFPSAALSIDPQRDVRTAQPPPPALLLPVEKIRIAIAKLAKLLEQPSKWEEALSVLSSPPLAEPEFRTTLDRYSDSNWNVHMLGDLYRNQGLESIKALKELMTFALEQQGKGVEISQEDVGDVREAGRALAASLTDFVSLAPKADLQLVEQLARDSSR